MPYTAVDGVRLFYKDLGKGRPLVLLPGLGADSTAYNPLLPRLRARVRVIAPDPPGLGRSGDILGTLTSHRLAQDVRGILDHLAIPRAALLGTSMGAFVARRFATLYPRRVSKLVLCAAGESGTGYARRIRRLLRLLVDRAPREDLMGHLFTLIFSPSFIDTHEAFLRNMEQILCPDERTLRTMVQQLTMAEEEAGGGTDPVVQAPVLIMAGAEDRLVPVSQARALHRSIQGSRLLVLEKAAHHPFLEDPEAAVQGLLDFLEEEEDKVPPCSPGDRPGQPRPNPTSTRLSSTLRLRPEGSSSQAEARNKPD